MRQLIITNTPEQTTRLAQQIGPKLGPGDCLLLSGSVGAGKTHFARAIIQSILAQPEDVPSPTFTLVQTYETSAGEVWHADLYRLNTLDDLQELGLVDAFAQAICLIEWPELLGNLTPKDALSLTFVPDPTDQDSRQILFQSNSSRWADMMKDICNDN